MEQQEILKRAYTSISSLKEHLPDYHTVQDKYVNQYHAALDKLASLGIDVEEFRIPPSELKPQITSFNYLQPGQETYSEHPEVERSFFMYKIDSLLGYFSLNDQSEGKSIGFKS